MRSMRNESRCVECGEVIPAGSTAQCKFGGECSWYAPRQLVWPDERFVFGLYTRSLPSLLEDSLDYIDYIKLRIKHSDALDSARAYHRPHSLLPMTMYSLNLPQEES